MMANLEEAQYHANNARIFGLLKVWLCHAEWWTFIHQYNVTNDGHGMWLVLKAQMEGPAAIEARKAKVHVDLETAYYSGKNKQFTWDDYVCVCQEAHLELELLKALVDEGCKVMLLLAGVKAHELGPTIKAIRANKDFRTDFEATQQQVKTAITTCGTEACHAATRAVSFIVTEASICSGTSSGSGGSSGGYDSKRKHGGCGGGKGKKQRERRKAAKETRSSLLNPPMLQSTIWTLKSMLATIARRITAHFRRNSKTRSMPSAKKRRRRKMVWALVQWWWSVRPCYRHPRTGWPRQPTPRKVPKTC
jgi:hypothetical protein